MTHIPERIPGGGVDLSHLAAGAQRAPQAPPAASGQSVDVPSLVLDVSEASFEQVAQLSQVVPVVFDLWAEWCEPCKTLSPVIEKVTRELEGRVLLAKVDVDANPGLAQAFQAQSIPTVVALVGGRPVPLFQGAVPEAQVREFFAQLLQLAAQNGVNGSLRETGEGDGQGQGDADPELDEAAQIPEAHRAAVEAAERGDFDAAVSEWEQVLQKAPADAEARAALVQMRLLQRLSGLTADEIRSAAASDPRDVEAALRVADLDVSGGHVEDAFLRLLDLFASAESDDDRSIVRERLLELFEVVGAQDPRVTAARGRLANLLY